MEQQLNLGFRMTWGGARNGAGRPKKGDASVPHVRRPFHDWHHPVHVTWRVVSGLPSLRLWRLAGVVGRAFRASKERHEVRKSTFRVVHFSIQSNHLHLIVEAGSKTTLARGLRGLAIRIARRLNAALGRNGQVFEERYHARPLTVPKDARNTIVYVLQNHRHHAPSSNLVDECSSAAWWDGWEASLLSPPTPSPVSLPGTWLMRLGWRRNRGPIRFTEAPRS